MKECPHCMVDLACPKCMEQPKSKHNGLKTFLFVGVLLGTPLTLMYYGEDHQRFIKFTEQRDAWHRKCDAYRDVQVGDPRAPIAAACEREAKELLAYGRRQGWSK